jgi:hypothetical protein
MTQRPSRYSSIFSVYDRSVGMSSFDVCVYCVLLVPLHILTSHLLLLFFLDIVALGRLLVTLCL